MRPRPVALATLLLAACCLGGGGPGILESGVFEDDGTPVISGREAALLAREEEEAWADDAMLLLLTSAETAASHASFPSDPPPYRMFEDDALGDGRVAQWLLAFHSVARKQAYPVVVAGDGQVAKAPISMPTLPVLGDWDVDSTVAARLALRDANVRLAVNQTDGLFGYSLARMGEHPAVWTLVGISDSANVSSATVYVDAVTGERIADPNAPAGG